MFYHNFLLTADFIMIEITFRIPRKLKKQFKTEWKVVCKLNTIHITTK